MASNSAETTIKCIACRETIYSGASVCRYCGSPQSRNRWQKLSTGLKWIGGVVTVISLLIGMFTLAGFYVDWRERRDAVTELVDAADWLIKTKDYPQAWQMYEEALQLVPSAANVRRGQFQLAKVWLRDFKVRKERTDELLNRITVILYRGIQGRDQDEVATIFAHICWAQILRAERSLPVTINIGAAFQQALDANPDNVYANAMMGYWILIKQGVQPEDVFLAQSKFVIALKGQDKRSFVRRLQFAGLVDLSYGSDDEVEEAALAVLLRESFSMMGNGEAKPNEMFRYRILDAYGNRAQHIEASIDFLPPADHLAVHQWLMDGLDLSGGNERKLNQGRYLRARLTEAQGKEQEALEQYKSLLTASKSDTTKQLDNLVNKAIARITGELPERALARTYINDPVEESDLWNFHLDTLAYFNPKFRPDNFDQAVKYFDNMVTQSHEELPMLVRRLPKELDRIRSVVREGDERGRSDFYTFDFSSSDHDNARFNLVRLSCLYARALIFGGELDKAIAELGDMKKLSDKLGDDWSETRARVAFELARAYAIRAEASGNDMDSVKALKYLKMSIEGDGVNGEITTWREIKSATFKSIWDDPGYKELIRGR